jgi:hypothetical protein
MGNMGDGAYCGSRILGIGNPKCNHLIVKRKSIRLTDLLQKH